jgi:hypothetical protein
MILPLKPPRLRMRRQVLPAPRLTKDGCCSDCSVQAMLAGEGELKVCPQCHALLLHVDWSVEERPASRWRARASATGGNTHLRPAAVVFALGDTDRSAAGRCCRAAATPRSGGAVRPGSMRLRARQQKEQERQRTEAARERQRQQVQALIQRTHDDPQFRTCFVTMTSQPVV